MIGELGFASQQAEKLFSRDDQELGRRSRAGAGRARTAIQQCDFTEGVAGLHDVQEYLPAGRGTCADPYSARHDSIESVARIRLRKDHRVPLVSTADAP